ARAAHHAAVAPLARAAAGGAEHGVALAAARHAGPAGPAGPAFAGWGLGQRQQRDVLRQAVAGQLLVVGPVGVLAEEGERGVADAELPQPRVPERRQDPVEDVRQRPHVPLVGLLAGGDLGGAGVVVVADDLDDPALARGALGPIGRVHVVLGQLAQAVEPL